MAKNFFDVNDRTLEPSEVHRKSKEELYETAFNKDQRAILDEMSSGGGGDEPEVWFVCSEYQDRDGLRRFMLSGTEEHITELYTNADNYIVYLNGEELPFLSNSQGTYLWADSDDLSSVTKAVIVPERGVPAASYTDATTAPESVEVSVKANAGSGSGGGGGNEPLVVNATLNEDSVPTSLDRTWQEIYDAFPNTYLRICVNREEITIEELVPFATLASLPTGNSVAAIIETQSFVFITDSPSGYPRNPDTEEHTYN